MSAGPRPRVSVDEATACVRAVARPLGVERVGLDALHGRRLAAPIRAALPSPRTRVSAMDGYAVGPAGARRDAYAVVGEGRPGRPCPDDVRCGEAVRVFTGAPVPERAVRVVMQEHAVVERGMVRVDRSRVGDNRHIRSPGERFEVGTVLVSAGRVADALAVEAGAAAAQPEFEVFARPRVAIVSTGDELVDPAAAHLDPHATPDSVSYAVAAVVAEAGGLIVSRLRAPDDLPVLSRTAEQLVHDADVVVVTGGASVGSYDFARAMFEAAHVEHRFEGVAMRPGRPTWMGVAAGGAVVLGLPGNPAAALVAARLFLVPLLHGLAGGPFEDGARWSDATLAAPTVAPDGVDCFSFGHRDDAGAVTIRARGRAGADDDLLVRVRPGGGAACQVVAFRAGRPPAAAAKTARSASAERK